MFERILQKEGFVASFLQHLFDKNQINVNKVKLNQAHFSFLTRSLNSEIIHEFSAKDYSQLENLFYSLEVEINYRATQEKFTQKATKLMLAPVLNEMYLKLFEYFVDSEFPFICQHLLRNIRVNPKNTSVIYKANQLLQAN
jgi:hypothetical protein